MLEATKIELVDIKDLITSKWRVNFSGVSIKMVQ